MSRSASRQLTQCSQKSSGGAGIVKRVKRDGSGKLRRLWPEANLQHILLADGHQCVQFGAGIFFPVRACGENDRSRFVNIPLALISLARSDAAAVGAPPVPHHFQMKCRRAAQIGFERERLFLVVPAAHEPVQWQCARTKLHRDMRIFKTAGREVQAGVKAGAVQPVRIKDASFAGASRLHPPQGFGSPAAIVSGEQDIPSAQSHKRGTNVNDQVYHDASFYASDADGTSEVGSWARGQMSPKRFFLHQRLEDVENMISGHIGTQ
jgi:hypothetical protein